MFRKIEVLVGAVKAADYKPKLSRESKMRFNFAKVQKPLASAAKVVEAGNKISMGPNPRGQLYREKHDRRTDRLEGGKGHVHLRRGIQGW